MSYGFFDLLKLIGSLCLFLYGMKIMSEGIQKLAGDKMRSILSALTANRVFAVITGLFITTLVQSSSASTVMVVSFVNAGLLSLTQAIGVIMGANIGTTTTAWIISLLGFKVSISVISIPLIGIAFPMLFSKKDRWLSTGQTLIGFALLFLGLDYLKGSVPDLNSNPEMFEFLQDMTGYGFGSTLLFLGIGTLLTIVLQSSSATMALTLVMCNNGWIGFESGAAIVLGENIGTTITANLAALVGNAYAKRAALAHTLFNLIGVVWMLIALPFVLGAIDNSLVGMGFNSPFANNEAIPIALSIFHTAFNITNTLLLIGFVAVIEKVVSKVIKVKEKADQQLHLEYFGTGFLHTAELSLLQAKKETRKYAELTHRMVKFVEDLLTESDKTEYDSLLERIEKYEEISDKIEIEITNFLIKVGRNQVSSETGEKLRRLRRICNEIEKMGDVSYKMSTMLKTKKEEKAYFTPEQREQLLDIFRLLDEAFAIVFENLDKGEEYAYKNISQALEKEKEINQYRDKVREEVLVKIEQGEYSLKSGFYFNKLVTSCEKIGDNLLNINEAIAGINVE